MILHRNRNLSSTNSILWKGERRKQRKCPWRLRRWSPPPPRPTIRIRFRPLSTRKRRPPPQLTIISLAIRPNFPPPPSPTTDKTNYVAAFVILIEKVQQRKSCDILHIALTMRKSRYLHYTFLPSLLVKLSRSAEALEASNRPTTANWRFAERHRVNK